jgi:glycosyltransferase involved in cell wall biosynthesis
MIYVIIPTYNRFNTIIRAISSVMKEKKTIAIIVDD